MPIWLAAVQGAMPAAAQDPPPETGPTMRLDAITVTATGNPLESFEYPGQVSVIGRDQIENVKPSKIEDFLKFTPGVSFRGGPRRTGEVPVIRGFDGPDVTVLFDGVRQNFNSGHDGRLFIEPDLLRQVEVVRGPTSALYGSGGLGGVIEFRTVEAADFLRPGETSGVRFKTGYETANEEDQYHATAFTRLHEFDVIGSLGYRDAGPIELGDGNTLRDTDERLRSGLLKGSYTGIENHRFELSYLGYRGDVEEPNNPQSFGSDGITDKDIKNDTLRGGWRWNDPDHAWLDLSLVTYYTRNAVDETTEDDLGLSPEGTRLDREVDTVGLRLDNRSRIDHAPGLGSLLTYGVEGFQDSQNGASSATEDGEREGVPDAGATTGALFLQDELVLERFLGTPGSWLVIPGLRYDRFSNSSPNADDTNDGKLSPKLGISYLPTEWLMLFGNYAQAFRAPTFDELYADGQHFTIPGFGDNFFIANPDLKPQETTTYEVGAGLQFDDVVETGDRFSVKASYFWIDGKDFIDLQVDQPVPPACFPPTCNGTTQAANIADAELEGAEVEASYENRRILALAGYSRLTGENEDTGRPLGVQQPHRLTAQLGFKVHEIDTLVGARGIFQARLDRSDPGEERDAYQVYDLFASWQPDEPWLDGLRVDLGIDNLFDKTYSDIFDGAAEKGRSVKVAVGYTFRW